VQGQPLLAVFDLRVPVDRQNEPQSLPLPAGQRLTQPSAAIRNDYSPHRFLLPGKSEQ